ncbi:g7997 [Coccomyxa elongata]
MSGPPLSSEVSSDQDWQREYFNALPELEDLARRRKGVAEVTIMRASQLDAARLDNELTAMLREQFMRIFSLFQPRLITALKPELTLFLDFLIFRFTVWSGRPTPGSALMNLRYRNERPVNGSVATSLQGIPDKATKSSTPDRWGHSGLEGAGLTGTQRSMYGLGVVLLRYIWARTDQLAATQHWGDQPRWSWGRLMWRVMRWAETGFKLASLLNFLLFLRHGKYRSVLERLLGARLVYSKGSMARALSFEYLNRQLVWHELSELLLFLLPLINVARIKALVMSHLPRVSVPAATSSISGPPSSGAAHQQCPICGASEIIVPYVALPCEHRFCYYCLRAHTQSDPDYKCLQCGAVVTALRRWRSTIGSMQ